MIPSFFITHGAPTLAIEDNLFTQFLNQLGSDVSKPEGIVIFSAHWESLIHQVTARDTPHETIYDFGGFEQALFEVTYPAKGSIAIAEKVMHALGENGFPVRKNETRGLDHGSWVVLHHLFPHADIPVVAISVNPAIPVEEQYKIGKAVAFLRDQNLLIIGSGATVHNLRTLSRGAETEAWPLEFDNWLIDKVVNWDVNTLFQYKELAPYAEKATPDYEHFVPFFIAMGTGDPNKSAKVLHHSYQHGTLSLICIQFN